MTHEEQIIFRLIEKCAEIMVIRPTAQWQMAYPLHDNVIKPSVERLNFLEKHNFLYDRKVINNVIRWIRTLKDNKIILHRILTTSGSNCCQWLATRGKNIYFSAEFNRGQEEYEIIVNDAFSMTFNGHPYTICNIVPTNIDDCLTLLNYIDSEFASEFINSWFKVKAEHMSSINKKNSNMLE